MWVFSFPILFSILAYTNGESISMSMLEITSKCICIVRSNKEFIKRAALLPVIKWLLQQGSILSVVWEKQDNIIWDEFKYEIKAKKQRTRISDFYFLLIKITLRLLNTLKRKVKVTNTCFYIVLEGWKLLTEGGKCLHHSRS